MSNYTTKVKIHHWQNAKRRISWYINDRSCTYCIPVFIPRIITRRLEMEIFIDFEQVFDQIQIIPIFDKIPNVEV